MPDRRIDPQNPMLCRFGDVSDVDEDTRTKDEANTNDAAKTCDNFIIDCDSFYLMSEDERRLESCSADGKSSFSRQIGGGEGRTR